MKLSIPEDYDPVMKVIINKVSDNALYRAENLIKAYELIKNAYPPEFDKANGIPPLSYYLEIARIIAFNLRGGYDDVITCLLAPACTFKKMEINSIYSFHKQISDRIKRISETVTRELSAGKISKDEAGRMLEGLIYENIVDRFFISIKENITKNRIPQIYIIDSAYNLAKVAHQGQYRKSGEPFLVHPLKVAEILAEAGAESNIIAAAILHDVIEDSDYTFDDIAQQTNLNIAQLVDAVTSIEKDYEKVIESHLKNEQEPLDLNNGEHDGGLATAGRINTDSGSGIGDAEIMISFDKNDLDVETVNKLVRIVANNDSMIFALYIKAADRIHNLRTMDSVVQSNREKKVAETRKYYIPVFKKYKLNIFIPLLEDLCWRISAPERYEIYKANYRRLLDENDENTQYTCDLLRKTLEDISDDSYSQFKCEPFVVEIKRHNYTPFEVFNMLKDIAGDQKNINVLVSKQNMPLFDLNIILHNRNKEYDVSSFLPVFMEQYRDVFMGEDITIIHYGIERYDKQSHIAFKIILEDRFHCYINLYFYTSEAYSSIMHGTSKGFVNETAARLDVDYFDANNMEETIVVKKRNGQNMILPKGSTVLDFAFEIHEELGLTTKDARINNLKADIYRELQYGDEIVIIADSGRGDSESDKMLIHAKIDWLNHVATEKAKKKITKYLQGRYEGQNPREEYRARPQAVASISEHIYNLNSEIMQSAPND